MIAIRIVNWQALYEVSDKGRAWHGGDKKRQGPLQFVRCRVNGSNWSGSYRDFLKAAGKSAAACFGVFIKALEIAADQPVEHRGWLLDRNGSPLDAEGFAKATGFAVKDVQRGLDIASDSLLGWLEWAELPESLQAIGIVSSQTQHKQSNTTQSIQGTRNVPGKPGSSREPRNEDGNGKATRLKADALIVLYKMVVEPPTKDDSPARGRKNAAKYLMDGYRWADLCAAVVNYGETVNIQDTEQTFRKRCGNFFGRQERFFEDYLPGEYQKPNLPDDSDDDELSRRNWEQMQEEVA